MSRIAWLPSLIAVGLVAATLSSALASFLGAPRILQALAEDRVIPALAPFARGHGAMGNPRRAVALTLAIALGCVALGRVNVLAPVVSMFFLISYGLLNYATALEARAASPSFRPRFRWFHHRASLLGAACCLGVMLMIDVWASALALAVMFALHQYVHRIAGPNRWADSRRDQYYHSVRQNLLAMAHEPVHPRNWRPHLLVFSDEARRRASLVEFASWVEGGAGLTTSCPAPAPLSPSGAARLRARSPPTSRNAASTRSRSRLPHPTSRLPRARSSRRMASDRCAPTRSCSTGSTRRAQAIRAPAAVCSPARSAPPCGSAST
jgi:hypothetical protein